MKRFSTDSFPYDDHSYKFLSYASVLLQEIEGAIERNLKQNTPEKALVFTHLEDAFFRLIKAVEKDQTERNVNEHS